MSLAQKLVVEREAQTALEAALIRLDESWSILADLQIGPKDEIAAEYVALHPARGIALIDLASSTRNDPTDRLRRILNSQDFTFRFPGVLPVVRLVAEVADAATIADRLEAAFAKAPAITITKRGWVNEANDILIGRVRGARLPARAMRERPAHLAHRHVNTTSALDLDAWKYAPWRSRHDRPGHTVEPEVPRRPASHARRPGGFVERPQLSRDAPRSESAPGRLAISRALQRPHSAFAVLLGVIAGGMIGGGAVWLALSGSAGDRFEGALGGLWSADEPPSFTARAPAPPLAASAPTPYAAATPNASTASQSGPATPMKPPPDVGPVPPEKIQANGLSAAIPSLSGAPAVSGAQTGAERAPPAATVEWVASPAPGVEHTPAKGSPPTAAAAPTIPAIEAPTVLAPSAESPTQPTGQARLPDGDPWQTQAAAQHAALNGTPAVSELAEPAPTGSSVSSAEKKDTLAAMPSPATFPAFGPPALSSPPIATPSPLAPPQASSPPSMDKSPMARPAHPPAKPALEKSAASARRPMRTSEPRSKSTPTKQLGKSPTPKRYDGPPIDADQLPPFEAAVNPPPAPPIASAQPDIYAPTRLLPPPSIASGSPVVACHAYTSTLNVFGQPADARGVACRQPGGQWVIVQENVN